MTDFYAHFGLRDLPFTREVAVRDLYTHPDHEKLRAGLLRTVKQRQSGALIGPAGFGKTVLLRGLIDALEDVRYRVHYVKVTGLSKRDMSREIARSLGLQPVGTYPRLVQAIQEAVRERAEVDTVRSILILDDAHETRPEVLATLKALTNYEMDSRLLLSVLLAGQPGLKQLLSRADLEDVAQRLSWYGHLRAMSREETLDYVAHRCRIAGATRDLFDTRALAAIYDMGRGNPRATDRLARRALETAHEAGAEVVDPQHVFTARTTLTP